MQRVEVGPIYARTAYDERSAVKSRPVGYIQRVTLYAVLSAF
jgi:hypothetical protein